MIIKTVTVSRKNQITLPAEYVRSLNLDESRQMRIYLKGKELVVKPEPSLKEQLAPIHAKVARQMKGKKPLTDEELKEFIRHGIGNRAV